MRQRHLLLTLHHLLLAGVHLSKELLAEHDPADPQSGLPPTHSPPAPAPNIPEAAPISSVAQEAEAAYQAAQALPKYKRPVSEGTLTDKIAQEIRELLRVTPGLRIGLIHAALDAKYKHSSVRNAVWRSTQAGEFRMIGKGTGTRYFNKGDAPIPETTPRPRKQRTPAPGAPSFREENVERMTTPGTTIFKAREDILQQLREHPGAAKGRADLSRVARSTYGGENAPSLGTYKVAVTLMKSVGDIVLNGEGAYEIMRPSMEAPPPAPPVEAPSQPETSTSEERTEEDASSVVPMAPEPEPEVVKPTKPYYTPPTPKTVAERAERAEEVLLTELREHPDQVYSKLFDLLTKDHKFKQPTVHAVFAELRKKGTLVVSVRDGKTVYSIQNKAST